MMWVTSAKSRDDQLNFSEHLHNTVDIYWPTWCSRFRLQQTIMLSSWLRLSKFDTSTSTSTSAELCPKWLCSSVVEYCSTVVVYWKWPTCGFFSNAGPWYSTSRMYRFTCSTRKGWERTTNCVVMQTPQKANVTRYVMPARYCTPIVNTTLT